jgi:hypothetical protein
MVKLTKGQTAVLALVSAPMAAVGVAGAVATYVNMDNVLHRSASALGLVAAGEGATLIASLVALAVTLMGQHTPMVVRLGMWVIPLVASAAGVALAPTKVEAVVMGVTPLAMTAAGEGITFVARRVVAYRTGVDIEQQRRAGLMLWHANRAANGSGLGKKISKAAVWRLAKAVAETDSQLSVQLSEVQRFHIADGASDNLSAILTKAAERPSLPLAPAAPALPPAVPVQAAERPSETVSDLSEDNDSFDWIRGVLDEGEARVAADPQVRLLTSDEVAIRLNVKPGTVRSWVNRDKLRVHDRDANGRSLFHPDDVDRLP